MSWPLSRNAVAALIAWISLTAAALAQVEVRSPSAKLLDTTPGRIVTASVVVANRGSETDDFTETLTLPPGCQRVSPPELPFRLEGGAQIVRILAVQIPANMPAGRFELRYVAQGRLNPSSIGRLDLAVQVLPVEDLEIAVDPRSDPVIAGDNYPVKVRVSNHGNTRLSVQLCWRSSLNYRVTGSASEFVLEAGATRELLCRVETDKQLTRRLSHAVNFVVKAASATGKDLTQSRAAVAEIIPLTSGDRDPFHRIPIQFKLSAVFGTNQESLLQAELSGAGSLDEAGRHKVDFLFRGPGVEDASFFGQRDEYGMSYHGEHWDVSLGDRIYELSPLTEKYGFGRGAGVTYRSGSTTAGAFYMATLGRENRTEEIGAFVRQQFGGFSVQGNFLRKWGGSDLFAARALPQNIYSFETRYQRGKELDLRLEYGLSQSDSGRTDFGFHAEARGQLFGKVDYAVEHVYAGPGFHGYASDTQSTYASVSVPITKAFRVNASLNSYAGNLELNPERSSVVNRENSWSAGMNYRVGKATDLSLAAQRTERSDILMPAAYDFTESAARIGVAHDFGKIQMQSFLDLGDLDNRLTGESGPFQRYSGYLNYRPTPRQNYSVFASYGPSAFTGSTDTSLNAGVSASWQLKQGLTANISYAHNQYNSLDGAEQDQAMGAIRYRCANKDEISVMGRWMHSSQTERQEAGVMVTFTRPFNVAVSRKTSIGTLRGRLVADGVGVPRAVLAIGDLCAVTDSLGEFEFPSLKPGTCELKVQADSLGSSLVVATPLPKKIRIRSAETTSVELRAVKAATVSVRLTVFEFAGNGITSTEVKAAGGVDAETVELTNGHDVLKAQTDRNGEIIFERVPCGQWTVRVHDDRLPAQHSIERPEQAVELKAGETKQVDVRILPRRRTIQMIDRGSVR